MLAIGSLFFAQTPKKTPKRTLKGGIVCEILKEGTGPEAKRGKMVGMYYDGRYVPLEYCTC